jgi:hypothetical protein
MVPDWNRREFLVLCSALVPAADAAGQVTNTGGNVAQRSADAQQVLSWLPSNTETVIVITKPFSLPDLRNAGWNRNFHVEAWLRAIAFTTLSLNNGALLESFRNQQVLFAVEGSRHFRTSKSLGWFPFEGCTILLFADDQGERADSFFTSASGNALRVEEIDGLKILVFEQQMESGLWTTFVAFRQPNILLVATNLDYLREVLSRMRDNSGPGALPGTLPEWKYVKKDAEIWALRHYDRSQGDRDPTSPLWDPNKVFKTVINDEQAIGLTFSFDPLDRTEPTITYLSGNPSIAKKALGMSFEGNPANVKFRELDMNAIEASYGPGRSTDFILTLVLPFLLGHGIAI